MRISHLVSYLVILLVGSIGLFYLLVHRQTSTHRTKPIIVCTTTIIGDTIANIAGDTIDIKTLMGPGVDPHLYKPVEQDVITIANADIIFYNGLHLEARMAELFEQMGALQTTVAVTRQIPQDKLIYSNEFHEYVDPHVWFDPLLWIYAVKTITTSLQQLNPACAAQYETNQQIYIEKIKDVYSATLQHMRTVPKNKRILITGHDAFSYFARAYDCKVISLQGISTASEAGTQDVQNMINTIVKYKIPTIFAESCIPTRNMQALVQGVVAQGFHVTLGRELFSDALGSPDSSASTYLGMLDYNVASIVMGLNRFT